MEQNITNTRINRKPRRGGFTLLEMMVVIAILAIVAGIAIPAYLGWKPGYLERSAVSRVRGDLNRAKLQAAERGREVRVGFQSTSYTIDEGDTALNAANWTTTRTVTMNDLPGITIKVNSGSPVVFTPRGTVSSAPLLNISVDHDSGLSQTISVSVAGRIQVQ